MTDLTALIIAAGRGIRMGPRGEYTPKGLLNVGGSALVQRSVQLLHERGIRAVRIVTGHLSEQYEAMFKDVEGVELVHNPDFATTGSLRSLVIGLFSMPRQLELLESDLIYERAALEAVGADKSRIVVSGETAAGDEVYIWTRQTSDGKPVFDMMSKDVTARPQDHFGELTGISIFTSKDMVSLKNAAQARFAADPKSDYESAVVLMAQTCEIDCHLIPDLAWTEIDDETMLARATKVVWPEIQNRDTLG